MPRGDGTGPEGRGPLTGRQMGYCAGNDQPGFTAQGGGFRRMFGGGGWFGRGRGRGMGRGMGRGFNATQYPAAPYPENIPLEPQQSGLETAIEGLKERLSFFEKQLSDLKKED